MNIQTAQIKFDSKEAPSFYQNDSDSVELNNFAYGNDALESFIKTNSEALEAWMINEGEDSKKVKEDVLSFYIESSAEEAGLLQEYLTTSDCRELEIVLYRQMNEAIEKVNNELEVA